MDIAEHKAERRQQKALVTLGFVVGALLATVTMVAIRPAVAALPGQKWGTQLELGTVGNSTVIRVQDEALTCVFLQPKTGGPASVVGCWGAP
jgi:hypothetical protein